MWRDAALIGEAQLWSPGLEDGAAGPAAGSGTCAEKGPCLLGSVAGPSRCVRVRAGRRRLVSAGKLPLPPSLVSIV